MNVFITVDNLCLHVTFVQARSFPDATSLVSDNFEPGLEHTGEIQTNMMVELYYESRKARSMVGGMFRFKFYIKNVIAIGCTSRGGNIDNVG